ncbi:MAG: L-seryl-tRNA(Sec) selenium transferase [Syntrophorhabdus sp. PtaU1.Bin050]|nr:MAG: L-seryl-tRNA(Sec) selenium transferase [Syntrophorhabdus sp. PtaU1.Bin050]
MNNKEFLRKIPKVDGILEHRDWKELVAEYPEGPAKDALRTIVEGVRLAIKTGETTSVPSISEIVRDAKKVLIEWMSPRLKRVINGTGVIVHTNLGRSLLADEAIGAIVNAASHYTNLEYDLEKGTRGSRYDHCTAVLKKLTGAESALVVNNNAGAVFLILNTLAEGKEVVISRGELVEIGGSFRIPDVMKKSGAVLREVGTTNRTHKEDYEGAINQETGLLMKAHTSNYKIKGFTHDVMVEELVSLGRQYGVPTYFDAGSGLLFPFQVMTANDEPLVPAELAKGLDVVSFSGDKLPGAPQAGIILGRKSFIDAMKKNPLTRALRPDKLTIAGLESTLLLYLDREKAKKAIPTLRMIHEDAKVLRRKAQWMVKQVRMRCPSLAADVTRLDSEVGGGSLPDVVIPSFGVGLKPRGMTVQTFETRLRGLKVPIVGRIEKDVFLLDMRTIRKDELDLLIQGIESVLQDGE